MTIERRSEIVIYRDDFESDTAWYDVCAEAGFDEEDCWNRDTLIIVWVQAELTKGRKNEDD